MQQQFDSGKLGIWLFLTTEVLMFSGLFCAYLIYRSNHPEIFAYAHHELSITMGAINTVVLIVSSLTMAWAVRAAQLSQKKVLVGMLAATLLLAGTFLVVKYFEYSEKFAHGLYPGRYNVWYQEQVEGLAGGAQVVVDPAEATAAAQTAELVGSQGATSAAEAQSAQHQAEHDAHGHDDGHAHADRGPRPYNAHIFFGIYYMMTGLHGIHIIAGMIAIGWLLVRAIKGHFNSSYFGPVDYVGLYWHLVDLIWIYLFPLLYLIRS